MSRTTVARVPADAEKRLKGFIAKFEPRHQTLIRAVRKVLVGSGNQTQA